MPTNYVEDDDRLSSLPDDLIHKILSFADISDAISTSVLSSRWRFIWTSMPYLNFSHENFHYKYVRINSRPNFIKFLDSSLNFCKLMDRVFSHRNRKIQLFSIKLNCGMFNYSLSVEKVLKYAFDYQIQHVTLTNLSVRKNEFHASLFSSESLKHLTLTGSNKRQLFMPASTLELLALTTLHLDYVTLYENDTKCISLFSKCTNLQNLTLTRCRVTGLDGFYIFHPRLSSLALNYGDNSVKVVKVVAAQLLNLTINTCGRKHFIYAPKLISFGLEDISLLQFFADGFPFLQKVDLCFRSQIDPSEVFGLFRYLNNVKFLTLNLELVELLYSSMRLISHQPSPFANLNCLKIYMDNVFLDAQDGICTQVIVYLLNRSPSATFKMISHKEVITLGRRTRAEDYMVELRVLLEQEKANFETNMAQMDQVIAQMQQHVQGTNGQITKCWDYLSVQIDQGNAKTRRIISKLQDVQESMIELSASKRDMVQPLFDTLCVETNNVINNIMDCMKIPCCNVMKTEAI